jgi:hypothetical protein
LGWMLHTGEATRKPAMANHQTQPLGDGLHCQVPTLPWAAVWALSLPMVRSLIPCLTSEWCDAGRCLVVCGNKTYVTVMLFDLVWRRFTTCSSRIAL